MSLIFNQLDRRSETWLKVSKHMKEVLDKECRELEKTSITIEQTAALRGRIKLLRSFIALDEINPTMPAADNVTGEFV
jgi:hypothetical protein